MSILRRAPFDRAARRCLPVEMASQMSALKTSARRCVYCDAGPSIRGGLEPDGENKWRCVYEPGCEERIEKANEAAARGEYRCRACGVAGDSRRGFSMLADRAGYLCLDVIPCAQRALLQKASA